MFAAGVGNVFGDVFEFWVQSPKAAYKCRVVAVARRCVRCGSWKLNEGMCVVRVVVERVQVVT